MAIEIERKFLLKNDDWRRHPGEATRYRQGYLGQIDKASVRVRVEGDKAFLNIKSATLDIVRREYQYAIPLDEAEEMLNDLCRGPLVEKIRHHIHVGKHCWEVDEFLGDNQGLVVAEVELQHPDEVIDLPDWVGAEVSDDPRYYNVNLSTHPYSQWETK